MNPKLYHYIAQGMTTIDNVDDAEEMRLTDEAFDVLNFSQVIIITNIIILILKTLSNSCVFREFV